MLLIGLDFDGTVIKHKKKFTYDLDYELFENCKNVLDKLSKNGVKFVLNTARTGLRRWLAILYIKVNKLPIKVEFFNKKPVADIYIDDKNLYTKKIDWVKIEKEILKIKRKENK